MISKSLKKVLMFICIVMSILIVIGGCTPGEVETTTKLTEETTASNTTTTELQTTEEEIPIVELTLMAYGLPPTDIEDKLQNDRIIQYVQEQTHVKLNWINADPDQIRLALSSGTAGDIITVPVFFGAAAISLVKKAQSEDMFVDLGALVKENPGKYDTFELVTQDVMFKLYNISYFGDANKFFAFWLGDSMKTPYGAPCYNMKILNELNLKIPETFDDFISLLREIKRLKPDVTPFSFFTNKGNYFRPNPNLWNGGYGLGDVFFTTNGTHMNSMWKDKDGVWYDAAISEANKPIWKLINTLYDEGIIDQEIFTKDTWTFLAPDFSTGKVAVILSHFPNGNFGFVDWIATEYIKANPNGDAAKDIAYQPSPLKGPGGLGQTTQQPFVVNMATVIPKTSKNPERAAEFINWLYSDEGVSTVLDGIEGIHYTIDSNGNKVKNADEINADMEKINMKGSLLHPYFTTLLSAQGAYFQYKKEGGWLKAYENMKTNLRDVYSEMTPAREANIGLIETWQAEGLTYREPYFKLLDFTEEELSIIAKLDDVAMKYCSGFIVGTLDVDKDWDKFVQEYKDAGSDIIVNKFNKEMKEWETLYNTLSN